MLTGEAERQMRLAALHKAHYAASSERLLRIVNETLRELPLYERLGYPKRVDDLEAFARLPILPKASVIAARPSDLIERTRVIADDLAHERIRRVASSGTRAQASVWATQEGGASTPGTNDLIMGIDHTVMTSVGIWTSPQCSGTNCVIATDGSLRLLPPTADIFSEPDSYLDAVLRRFDELGPGLVQANPVIVHEVVRRLKRTGRRLPLTGAVTFSYQYLGELQRRRLVEALAVPMFRTYGATELAGSAVSVSCRVGTCHLWESQAYAEILDDDGEPTQDTGRVVVTVLGSLGTRLVRYDTGDLGRIAAHVCDCGLPSSRRLEVMGRRASAWRSRGQWVTEADLDARLARLPALDFAVTTRTRVGLRVAVVPADDAQVHADDIRYVLADIDTGPIEVVTTDRVTASAGKYPLQRRWDA